MALRVGLEYEQPLGGIFCYSGWYSPFTKPTLHNQKTPIYIQHGEEDNFCRWKNAKDTFKLIRNEKREFFKVNLIEKLGHEAGYTGLMQLRMKFDRFVGRKRLNVSKNLDN